MALIRCPECGREISDKAPACPYCGLPADAEHVGRPSAHASSVTPGATPPPHQPSKQTLSKQPLRWPEILVVIMAVMILVAVVGAMMTDGRPSSTAPEAQTVTHSPPDPAAELASLVRAIDDEGANRRARLASARLLVARHPNAPDRRRAEALIAQLEAEIVEESRGAQWSYVTHTDDMSGRQSKLARVPSTDSFQFGFPYNERQHATLTLRRHPRHGNDVIFSIEHGQILCHSFDRCRVRVRFDDGPTRTLTGREPADNSADTVFIPGYNDFVQRLGKAKTVRIEVDIFQEGALVAEFNVDGFKPDRLK
ncbi:zinc ribbon domain-containing protein [Luteimonas yindakuii]|nr:zinc ribbon domain-containing protein [Luteimonas yindakuii]